MKLAIYGAGGLGREVLELARQINRAQFRWEDFVFIDDINALVPVKGRAVYRLEQLSPAEYEIVIAVGEPSLGHRLAEKSTAAGFHFATLIHPQCQSAVT